MVYGIAKCTERIYSTEADGIRNSKYGESAINRVELEAVKKVSGSNVHMNITKMMADEKGNIRDCAKLDKSKM